MSHPFSSQILKQSADRETRRVLRPLALICHRVTAWDAALLLARADGMGAQGISEALEWPQYQRGSGQRHQGAPVFVTRCPTGALHQVLTHSPTRKDLQ